MRYEIVPVKSNDIKFIVIDNEIDYVIGAFLTLDEAENFVKIRISQDMLSKS